LKSNANWGKNKEWAYQQKRKAARKAKQEAKKAAKEASRPPKPPAGAKKATSMPFERTPASHHEEEEHVHNPFHEKPERLYGNTDELTEALGKATACLDGERFDEALDEMTEPLTDGEHFEEARHVIVGASLPW